MPERLELVKGGPSGRRAHLDQLVAAVWPARVETRSAYSRALAQRNALLARVRAGAGSASALGAWDAELAGRGIELMGDRREAVDGLRPVFAELAERLGLPGEAELRYRPRSPAATAEELVRELEERRAADLDRGFTAHGPHRDDLQLLLGGFGLRSYGSQGQQRIALLALLFAERALLAERRSRLPLMLLDDVMSELDSDRRKLLAELVRDGGQAVITATEPGQVPGEDAGTIVVEAGEIRDRGAAAGGMRRLAPRALRLALPGAIANVAARHPPRAGPGVLARGGGGRAGGFHGARGGARGRGHRGLRVVALGARAGPPSARSPRPHERISRGPGGRRGHPAHLQSRFAAEPSVRRVVTNAARGRATRVHFVAICGHFVTPEPVRLKG